MLESDCSQRPFTATDWSWLYCADQFDTRMTNIGPLEFCTHILTHDDFIFVSNGLDAIYFCMEIANTVLRLLFAFIFYFCTTGNCDHLNRNNWKVFKIADRTAIKSVENCENHRVRWFCYILFFNFFFLLCGKWEHTAFAEW